jgi:hypothetical protein
MAHAESIFVFPLFTLCTSLYNTNRPQSASAMAIELEKEIRTNGYQQDDIDGDTGADEKGHKSNKHNHEPADQDPAASASGGEQQEQQRAASLLQEKYRYD